MNIILSKNQASPNMIYLLCQGEDDRLRIVSAFFFSEAARFLGSEVAGKLKAQIGRAHV